ncbi:MAG: alpha/beta hydrolase [Bacteroidota bacterium]|nr:alpha/beta hydrolase [Bacteroidota bacterium]
MIITGNWYRVSLHNPTKIIMCLKKRLFGCLILVSSYLTSPAQTIPEVKAWLAQEAKSRPSLHAQPFSRKALTKKESTEAAALLLEDEYKRQREELRSAWYNKLLIVGADSLKFEYKIFGEKPAEGRSLFISMHGGGNAAPRVNDQQWQNQIRLYAPAEGVYVAPRAPTNTWNLWHEAHIDPLFDRLILSAVLFEGVNPNKVYLMGYSAGGDGVYQLAPRMADRFAAAAMMAGHPNETSPLGLRNIGFAIHMGALDKAYNRNEIAQRWGTMLDSLQQQDKGGYKHVVQLHEGRPHWMNREDSVAVPWMARFRRNPVPDKIVWKQDDVHHSSFYWLAVPEGVAQTGGEIVASYKDNQVTIESSYTDSLLIRLNDKMMNLDKPVIIHFMGKEIFKGKVERSVETIFTTTQARRDPGFIFSAELAILNGKILPQAR